MTEPAIMFGLLPSDFKSPREWNELNSRLKVSYATLQDETCPGCGLPIWLGHSTDREIQFKIKTATCYACAKLERERDADAKRESKKGAVKSFGRTKYVVFDRDESGPVPTRIHGLKSIPK